MSNSPFPRHQDVLATILGWPGPGHPISSHSTPFLDYYPPPCHLQPDWPLKKSLSSNALLGPPSAPHPPPPPPLRRASLPNLLLLSHSPPPPRPLMALPRRRRSMHGVASNDSIRTARPSAPPPARSRPRFLDPTIFDLFNQLHTLPAPSASHTPLTNALQITVTSQPGDDPRFVIWGHEHPTLPPAPPLPASTPPVGPSSLAIDQASSTLVSLGKNNKSLPSDINSSHHKRWSRVKRQQSAQPAPALASPFTTPHPASPPKTAAPQTRTRSIHNSPESPTLLGHLPPSSTPPPKAPSSSRILMAATIERWIAELTTRIDPRALVEFFLTYRAVLRPLDLCMLLTTRFEWTILFKSSAYYHHRDQHPDTSSGFGSHVTLALGSGQVECIDINGSRLVIDAKEEAGRRIVKVRTFVMLRHWLLNHFEDDFLRNRPLRTELTWWLKNLIHKLKHIRALLSDLESIAKPSHTNLLAAKGDEDLKILKSLKKVIKQRKQVYLAYNLVQPPSSVQARYNDDEEPSEKKRSVDVSELLGVENRDTSKVRLRPQSLDGPPSLHLRRPRRESGRTLGQVKDAAFAKTDLRLQQDSYLIDHLTDDEDDEFKVSEAALLEASEDKFKALAKYFAQDTHHMRFEEPAADDLVSRHVFMSRNKASLEPRPAATLNLHQSEPSSSIAHSRAAETTFVPSGTHLPHACVFPQQHNPLQRYFTSTMGTFGRFKRMIHNRSGAVGPYNVVITGAEAQEEANNEMFDLLCAKGGIERYLSFFGPDNDETMSQDEISSPSRSGGGEKQELQTTSRSLELSSPIVRCSDEDGFESQLSLSSSTSKTPSTSSSHPPAPTSDEKAMQPAVVSELVDQDQSSAEFGLSFVGRQHQALHESLSTETIKSESNHVGVGLFKKQFKKRFGATNPVAARVSCDGFSARPSVILNRNNSTERHSLSISGQALSFSRSSLDISRASLSEASRSSLSIGKQSSSFDQTDAASVRSGVQLDDLDLSEGSEEDWRAPRQIRRLKGAGNLKQGLRRSLFGLKKAAYLNVNSSRMSTETSSSVGTRRVPSIAASMFRRSKLVTKTASDYENEDEDGGDDRQQPEDEEGLGGIPVVANFVADGLDSDEDEPGDVEAALRRLEGVIDADREKEKAMKVERQMMKSVQASRRSRSSTLTSERSSASGALSVSEMDRSQDSEDARDAPPSFRSSIAEVEEGTVEDEDEASNSVVTSTVPAITFNHVAPQATSVGLVSKVHDDAKEPMFSPQRMSYNRSAIGPQAVDHKRSLHKLFPGSGGPSGTGAFTRPGSVGMGRRLALPPIHRSFLLDCRTEILAQQFCLIERDLLRKITWQEVLLGKWKDERARDRASKYTPMMLNKSGKRWKSGRSGSQVSEEVNCWETFIKMRARAKAESRGIIEEQEEEEEGSQLGSRRSPKNDLMVNEFSEIRSAIIRFNLTCNWVASEIVLTIALEERVKLLGKFIRLAFKCYRQNNFQTLTQIIHGLQTPYVSRLKKTWAKLGIWESRMFRDLKQFTSHTSNFKSLRNVQDELVDSVEVQIPSTTEGGGGKVSISGGAIGGSGGGDRDKERDRASRAVGGGVGKGLTGCIPFLGVYLRDLTINDELPTYLDPSEPSEPAQIDPKTGYLTHLACPEKFRNLDQTYQQQDQTIKGNQRRSISNLEGREEQEEKLYPLINIHKFRIYSKVISKILGFQEASLGYDFEAGEKIFLTCLKIKALNADRLDWLSSVCEP